MARRSNFGTLVRAASALGIAAAAGNAQAQLGLLIDDYTTAQSIDSVAGPDTGAVSGAGILGGEREITQNATVNVDITGGTMTLTNVGNFSTNIRFEYDGTAGSPFSVDLLGAGSEFGFEVLSTTAGNSIEVFQVNDALGGGNRTAFGAIDLSTVGNVLVPFTALDRATGPFFNPDPPADFTDISNIAIEFRLAVGGSLTVENLRVVPAPASAGLIALGGLAAVRRRR